MASYTYGPGIDNPIIMRLYGVGAGNYFYLKDHQGSITEITNSSGNIVKQYKYDAYGRKYFESGPTLVDEPAYTARQRHDRTGLYYYRNRFYYPQLGRFLSQDPIGHAGGTNLYAYVGNNPVNFIDPLGLTWGESLGLFLFWATGVPDFATGYTLSENMEFGPESNQVEDMMDAPGVNAARDLFYEKNAKCLKQGKYQELEGVSDYGAGFGLIGLIKAGFDPTEQFVGSYDIEITNNKDGTITFMLSNTTSLESFLYGLGPEWERSTFAPMGNVRQTFTWTEEITP